MLKKSSFLVILLALIFLTVGCQKKNGEDQSNILEENKPPTQEITENNDSEEAKNDIAGWKIYENERYNYQIKYPDEWYFVKDYCCPPPPVSININNYSSGKLDYANHQMDPGVQGLEIACGYEGKLDDIGEVKLYKDEGKKFEIKDINHFDAIIFEQNRGPGLGVSVFSYYIADGTDGCRLTFDST